MNKLLLILSMIVVTAGCGSSSDSGTAGMGGAGGIGGSGGTEPKCTTPQAMLRCDKVLNIAHRGGRRIRPEHTLLAYDQALEDGADILELDVGETSDGALVVMHDDEVDRTTDCTGLIKEMTFAEIRECDAGYEFTPDDGETYPYRGIGLVVPTLQEVFDRYPDVAFIIEIKQESPSIVDNFVQTLRDSGVEDKMIGSQFSDDVLAELRAAAPEIATNTGVNETLVFWGKAFDDLDPEYEPPAEFLQVPTQFDVGDRIVDVLHPGFIPRAHELDMYVHVWTINDEQEMRDLIALGVDGIMTDDPPLLTKVINELGVGD
ncbi:MAG: glycerophosphodiester phosphodiesterase [Polyangiales bacterium]